MIPKHIEIARRDGAKAGFRAYMAVHAPTVRERQAEIRSAGNSKAQFNAYCNLFSDQLSGATRAREQRAEVAGDVLEALHGDPDRTMRKLARLLGRGTDNGVVAFEDEVDDVEDDTDDVIVVDEPEASDVPVATRITWKMCTALFKRANKWGEKVVITGKDVESLTGQNGREYTVADYHIDYVFDDGSITEDLTPESASDLIGEFKAAQ